jgi:glycerate kinase
MSDGGDGFGPILASILRAVTRRSRTVDAAGRPCRVPWWFQSDPRTAIVESARVIGLAMLPPRKHHPFELDTRGLGRLLTGIARHNGSTCLLGIGGSATNDGGFGLASALGWKFLDRHGRLIASWPQLTQLRKLEPPEQTLDLEVVVATDVRNPLLGPRGASRVYGPQKGLRPEDQPAAEAALRRLADVSRDTIGIDHAQRPGAGAAGGLGFGLMAFLKARPEPGFELFARYAQLEAQLDHAHLVVTGEGAVDRSTLMGKGVGEIAKRCLARGIPCLALGGVAADRPQLEQHFTKVAALTDLTTPDQALAHPARWLTQLARRLASGQSYSPAGAAQQPRP